MVKTKINTFLCIALGIAVLLSCVNKQEKEAKILLKQADSLYAEHYYVDAYLLYKRIKEHYNTTKSAEKIDENGDIQKALEQIITEVDVISTVVDNYIRGLAGVDAFFMSKIIMGYYTARSFETAKYGLESFKDGRSKYRNMDKPMDFVRTYEILGGLLPLLTDYFTMLDESLMYGRVTSYSQKQIVDVGKRMCLGEKDNIIKIKVKRYFVAELKRTGFSDDLIDHIWTSVHFCLYYRSFADYPPARDTILKRIRYELLNLHSANYDEIEKIVYKWRDAWQQFDITTQMSFHADDFIYVDQNRTLKYEQYKKNKLKVFDKNTKIRVDIAGLRIFGRDNTIVATYVQTYENDSYWSEGLETLYFKKVSDSWKIYKETFEKYESHSR